MRKQVGPRVGLIRCSVQGCKNTNSNSTRSFFRLPKCKKRAERWMKVCPLTEYADISISKIKVCSEHFENCYLNSLGNRLMADPVPTIFPSFDGSSTPSSDSQWFEISAYTDGAGQEHNNFNNDRLMALNNGLIVNQYVVSNIELPPLVPIKKGAAALEFDSLSLKTRPYSKILDDDTVPPLVPISRHHPQQYPSCLPSIKVPPLVPIEPASRKSETTCYADVKLEDNPLTIKTEEIDFELTTVKVEEFEKIVASSRTEVGLDLKEEEDQDLDEKGDIRLLIDSESAESYFDAPDYVWITREP